MDNVYLDTLLTAIGTLGFIMISSLLVAVGARWIARVRGATPRRQGQTFAGYLFVSPWLVGFLIFVLTPMLASIYWSFTHYKPPDPAEWVGLRNYLKIFEDKDFIASLINTLFLTAVGVPLQILTALGLALLLNQKARGEKLFRLAFYLPVVLGLNSAVLLSWRLMLNANNGVINTAIRTLVRYIPPIGWLNRALIYLNELISSFFISLQYGNFNLFNIVVESGFPAANRVPLWLQSPLWTKTSIILLMMWGCGTMMLFYLAALNNVPKELYEAAEVDGASPWQRFRHVTLPLITPYTFYNLIVGTIAAIQIFEQTYVLFRDNQTVAQSAYSVVYYLWRATFRFNEMGYGSAISWILLVLILVITLVQFRFEKRWVVYDVR